MTNPSWTADMQRSQMHGRAASRTKSHQHSRTMSHVDAELLRLFFDLRTRMHTLRALWTVASSPGLLKCRSAGLI